MPIGGFVITVAPGDLEEIKAFLKERAEIEIHGTDDNGNIVSVIETKTSNEMDSLVLELEKDERILSVGLTYLNAEDEIEKFASGELHPGNPFGRRKKNRS